MDIMNQIEETLDKNTNISEAVKENIFELVSIFHQNFPNIDLSNLNNRLSNLVIDSGSKYVYKEISNYNPTSNVLNLNMEELAAKDHDMKHVLMYELLHIITAKDNCVGFDKDNALIALNTGYTEILTNNLVGNESDIDYHNDEVIATNLIANMIENDIMFKAYFTNDFKLINNVLENAGLGKVIEQMNFHYYNQENSSLAQIFLGIEKASLENGTYDRMSKIFDREILSNNCFSDSNHKDMDNLIKFNRSLKGAMSAQIDETIQEETHSRTM